MPVNKVHKAQVGVKESFKKPLEMPLWRRSRGEWDESIAMNVQGPRIERKNELSGSG